MEIQETEEQKQARLKKEAEEAEAQRRENLLESLSPEGKEALQRYYLLKGKG